MKKKMLLVILVIFPISGNNGKYIKIYDIEKKKIFSAKPFLGYCPIYIVKKKKFVLQDSGFRRLVYGFLCCNTVVCIAEIEATVLQ